jgi:hypothetical protein
VVPQHFSSSPAGAPPASCTCAVRPPRASSLNPSHRRRELRLSGVTAAGSHRRRESRLKSHRCQPYPEGERRPCLRVRKRRPAHVGGRSRHCRGPYRRWTNAPVVNRAVHPHPTIHARPGGPPSRDLVQLAQIMANWPLTREGHGCLRRARLSHS